MRYGMLAFWRPFLRGVRAVLPCRGHQPRKPYHFLKSQTLGRGRVRAMAYTTDGHNFLLCFLT